MMATAQFPSRQLPTPALRVQGMRPWWTEFLPLLPLIFIMLSMFAPPEMRVVLFDQTIFAYRAVALILTPWVLLKLVQGSWRFSAVDLFIVGAALWMTVSFVAYYGLTVGLPRGLGVTLDLLVPYLIARFCIRSQTELRLALLALAPFALLSGLLILVESVSHQPLVRPWAASVFGALPAYVDGVAVGVAEQFEDYRLGLLRVSGPFPHPILAGTFLASLLPLFYFSSLRKWPLYFGFAAGALSFFTVSSAAILAIILFILFASYEKLNRMVALASWKLLIAAVSITALFVQLASGGGLLAVLIPLTFSPQTGYYRRLIWQYGSNSVVQHPLIGIGYTDYERLPWMNTSIDAHWLSLAVRHGLPVPILMLGGIILLLSMLSRAAGRTTGAERSCYVGLAFTLAIITIVGFTVGFFGSLSIWLAIVLGMATSIGVSSRSPGRPLP
jgi:hypothetical protein